jgi:hypothetical protein
MFRFKKQLEVKLWGWSNCSIVGLFALYVPSLLSVLLGQAHALPLEHAMRDGHVQLHRLQHHRVSQSRCGASKKSYPPATPLD